jgi:hypothetical protein
LSCTGILKEESADLRFKVFDDAGRRTGRDLGGEAFIEIIAKGHHVGIILKFE